MDMIFYLAAAFLAAASAQQYTTPVPILKQINKHNEDGSYSYGYEAADGTFKIETKYPNGEVYGKYGYVDDTGKLREIEYGASRRGFEPTGNEINVPPPTLTQNSAAARPLGPNQEDDGQYREDPSVYYKDEQYNVEPARTSYQQQPAFTSRFSNTNYNYQPQSVPSYSRPQSVYQPQPAFRPQPQYDFGAQRAYNPAPPAFPNYNQFGGHPATNVDINSGSYTVNYRRR